ncbi:MAG: hypothetical protein JSS86_16495 [Cyanobacteria bacterium SZAS LIN-2]|nr:hypothetical protein [Cyanobacteria bacterium SZAS LIN-3]MBS1997925.1 hypothetical protein [Cyanobacteria bacterium SZAS LIN-2]
MKAETRRKIMGALGPSAAAAFICAVCLVSILYVNSANDNLKENNRWQTLTREEGAYPDIKQHMAAKNPAPLTGTTGQRARELASIYRQEGKQEEAAAIYRLLWLSAPPGYSRDFAADARDLASLYTDMGAFSSAVASYQKILQYDQNWLPANDPRIACDLNNLGQCYYTAGCAAAEPGLRRKYLTWAGEQFAAAQKLAPKDASASREIIKLNRALLALDMEKSK